MKKGFTLIELLGVIIVLSVIALITTPMVLNAVDEARLKADLDSAYAYLEAAKLYYYEAQFDDDKMDDLNNRHNIYDKVSIKGTKAENGELYATNNATFALAIELNDKCYYKDFDGELSSQDLENCSLGWVGIDEVKPTIEFSYDGEEGNNDWYKSSLWVTIKVKDLESGPSKIKWCMGSDCEPSEEEKSATKAILLEQNVETVVCAIGYDKQGNVSEKVCSKQIKIDTEGPSFTGIEDLTIMKDSIVDLRSGVSVEDNISGATDFTVTPETVDTSVAGTKEVIYTAIDNAGNIKEIKRKIIVDSIAPTVTYTPESGKINSSGWAKDDFYVDIVVNDQSGLGIKEFYICTGNESDQCIIQDGSHITSGNTAQRTITVEHENNRICVQATDNNGKTSEVICSDAYKLDKTAPTPGTVDIVGTLGSNGWYTTDVTLNKVVGTDGLSGHEITTITTNSVVGNTLGTTVTVTTIDKAGNSDARDYIIKIDKDAPIFTVKSTETEKIMVETSVNTRTYFNTPTYSISGDGSISCDITDTASLAVGTHTITCTATGVNGLSTTATKTIEVTSKMTNFVITNTIGSYDYNSNYRSVDLMRIFLLKDNGTVMMHQPSTWNFWIDGALSGTYNTGIDGSNFKSITGSDIDSFAALRKDGTVVEYTCNHLSNSCSPSELSGFGNDNAQLTYSFGTYDYNDNYPAVNLPRIYSLKTNGRVVMYQPSTWNFWIGGSLNGYYDLGIDGSNFKQISGYDVTSFVALRQDGTVVQYTCSHTSVSCSATELSGFGNNNVQIFTSIGTYKYNNDYVSVNLPRVYALKSDGSVMMYQSSTWNFWVDGALNGYYNLGIDGSSFKQATGYDVDSFVVLKNDGTVHEYTCSHTSVSCSSSQIGGL